MVETTKSHISNSIKVKSAILNDQTIINQINDLGTSINACLQNNGKIIFAGNGGSFADSQHLATEFVSKLKRNRKPLPALALGTNSSLMSACLNDYGPETVFARELEVIGAPGDIFIPISTSGNSINILQAIDTAIKNSIRTVGLSGDTGGLMFSKCDVIRVPSQDTALIQEAHIMIGHILCMLGEDFFE